MQVNQIYSRTPQSNESRANRNHRLHPQAAAEILRNQQPAFQQSLVWHAYRTQLSRNIKIQQLTRKNEPGKQKTIEGRGTLGGIEKVV
jgi:hypothetical protein